ncbi:MAG TPA: DUF1697 domain-containing protein [Candidatus Saccharimonadales bacterium]|nr:DUF1697 domain-containing protein [Candidatus Saccharimonadales bacterium]
MKYLALFRGVNVGGKNRLSMAELKTCLEGMGLKNVRTYINSGNAVFEADEQANQVRRKIEQALAKKFTFDSDLIKVLVISKEQLAAIVRSAPKGFGETPEVYYSDVAFLIDEDAQKAFDAFELNPEVDTIWMGEGVIYYRRLGALRTKSRLSKIIGKPVYKNMTIRNWNTTKKLLALLEQD